MLFSCYSDHWLSNCCLPIFIISPMVSYFSYLWFTDQVETLPLHSMPRISLEECSFYADITSIGFYLRWDCHCGVHCWSAINKLRRIQNLSLCFKLLFFCSIVRSCARLTRVKLISSWWDARKTLVLYVCDKHAGLEFIHIIRYLICCIYMRWFVMIWAEMIMDWLEK